MSTNTTSAISYNDSDYKALMADFKTLSTFAQVTAWDERAGLEVDRIANVIRELTAEGNRQREAIRQIQQDRAAKPLLARAFSGNKEEKAAAKTVEQIERHMAALETLATELQQSIDFSPNSPDEQKALIKELRQRKKELQLKKREVVSNMQALRSEARQQSTIAGNTWLGLYNSKLAARERRQIRYNKETALRPQESAKAAIERQILQVERDILWAEKFKA